ncbi:putative cysteine-rich receptor-like protein kinase 20 [Hordeum vulgare]|nr:putative cysteine-rich receptor-like protein kinase 20 [Hordeum vulgare]
MQDHLSEREFLCFSVTLWTIWRARRKAIYEDIFHSPLSTHHFINSYLAILDAVENLGTSTPTVGTPTDRPKGWQQPPASLSKINADAAVSRNQLYGTVAAVCRSHEGLFLDASTIVFEGIHDPPTLDALVVQEALALAEDLNLQEIHVASDCKVVMDDIKQ